MTDKYSIGVDLGGTNLRVAAYRGGIVSSKPLLYRHDFWLPPINLFGTCAKR
jgi:hypothetical protein